MTTHYYARQIIAISEEHRAARAALTYVVREWHILKADVELKNSSLPEVQTTLANIDSTYIIRLFVRFEAILREYLVARFPTQPVPYKTEALINRVAKRTRPNIPDDIRDKAHGVRNYRNDFVHSNANTNLIYTFQNALRDLIAFLYWTPDPP